MAQLKHQRQPSKVAALARKSYGLIQLHHQKFMNIERKPLKNYDCVSNSFSNNAVPTKKKINQKKCQKAKQNQQNQITQNCVVNSAYHQSLLGRIKKLNYMSNPNSRPSSPVQHSKTAKTHRRNISANQKLDIRLQKETLHSRQDRVSKKDFQYKYVIGRGGFGKVWKVQMKKNRKIYALKEMSKALIISKKSVPSVMNQKKLLSQLQNPFIVNMVQSMQDRENLYLLMEYLPGGDLRYHIAKRRQFSQEETKFIICCILMGLSYLHDKNIIHRDIKPQNLVIDEKGYVRVTDMGIARKLRPNNAQDTSGTPGYMAPQVLCRQDHSYAVDYFAVGVIAYQLMLKRRPYNGRSRKQIRDDVLARQVQVKRAQIPDGWSMQACDFINKLILRKPHLRLGSSGFQQIRNHPWLRLFPFDSLASKQLIAPYVPSKAIADESFDSANISQENTEVKELIQQNEIMLRNPQFQQIFEGYQLQHQANRTGLSIF